MRSISKKGKGKTWPPMLSSTKKNSKRKKSSGLVDQGIKRHKTLPLYDRTNQQNNSKGSYFVQLKISEGLPSKKSDSFASIFAVSKRTALSSHKHVLHTEETLDSDCNQSSQEQEFIPQFHDQPSGTETESNLSNPADSSCSSMDELLYDNSIDENAMIVDSNMSQDKPLTSFPKISKSSSFNLAIGKEQKPSVFGNQNALKASEINSFFDLLPEEILVAIFRYLPLLSREQTSIVCKLWYKISKKNRLLEIFSTDIYGMMVKNMRKHRKHLRKYLELRLQPDISSEMRSTLVDWLIDVAEEFRVQPDTLFLCVRYVDQYLSKIESSIARNRFQLVGVTSLLIASKYEELYVPTIADLTFISDNTYTRDEIIAMEGNILNTLSFDITMFTVKQFLQYYLNLLFEDKKIINNKYTQSVTDFSHYLAELSLLSYKLSMQRPDRVASAIILTSLNTAGVGSWPEVMKEETFFTHVDFQDCVEELYNLHNGLGNSPFSAIRSKARFAAHIQVTLPQMRY